MSQILEALKGNITEEVEIIAKTEKVLPQQVQKLIAKGQLVVLRHNKRRPQRFCGVGRGLQTKINVNVGTSPHCVNLDEEMQKIEIAEQYKADAIMDLSTGGDIDQIRQDILDRTQLPVGTVPVYQAVIEAGSVKGLTADGLFSVIEKQAKDGVDFLTVHCGVTLDSAKLLSQYPRVGSVVSRGGSSLMRWMQLKKEQNPLYSQYDRLLDIAAAYDIVLSLGDGMRPGCIADATDRVQIQELEVLAKLAKRALKRGVQVMIEGPGHVPLDQVSKNIHLQKKLCHGAPFYVLGPVVTDIAPGYDHITAAIGGALAAAEGADFLCYVTPAEHLRLPTIDDVKEGVIATKIAAHAADIAKGVPGAKEKDLAISKARVKRDWKRHLELALDPHQARAIYESRPPQAQDVCTMCGEFCSLKTMEEE